MIYLVLCLNCKSFVVRVVFITVFAGGYTTLLERERMKLLSDVQLMDYQNFISRNLHILSTSVSIYLLICTAMTVDCVK